MNWVHLYPLHRRGSVDRVHPVLGGIPIWLEHQGMLVVWLDKILSHLSGRRRDHKCSVLWQLIQIPLLLHLVFGHRDPADAGPGQRPLCRDSQGPQLVPVSGSSSISIKAAAKAGTIPFLGNLSLAAEISPASDNLFNSHFGKTL